MKRGIRSRPRWLIGSFLLAMFVITPLVLAACGGDDDEDTTTAPAPTAQVVERTVEVVQTVIVVATPAPVATSSWALMGPPPTSTGTLPTPSATWAPREPCTTSWCGGTEEPRQPL